MSLLRAPLGALAGRWLSLPAPRCRVARSDEWVTLGDGARIPAAVFRPEAATRVTLVGRSIAPIHGMRHPLMLLARLLAEQGHAVVVAGFRGLQGSRDRFEPFLREGGDGADLLDWVASQPWSDGPLALHGFGYAGHAAWATLAAARRPVEGLAVGFAARDPHAWLYAGGALRLEAAFDLALALAAAEPEPIRTREMARALRHRPLIEADRVAARRIDWLREWLEHPQRDVFWEARTAALPQRAPRALLVGGWHHATLDALLADHAALRAAADRAGADAPRLRIGPWAATPLPRPQRDRRARMLREAAHALATFLEELAGEQPRPEAPVRAFVSGMGWRDCAHWPPDGAERIFHLAGRGRAGGRDGESGRLSADAGPAAGADSYLYDPADAAPSEGGESLVRPGEAPTPDGPGRGDTLRYQSDALESALEIAGAPVVELYVESTVAHTDFGARLCRLRPDGRLLHLCAGIARVALPGGAPRRIEIRLSPLWQRLSPGDRLRLELSSASFPRFDRHPNRDPGELPTHTAADADGVVARQTVHHGPEHPSRVRLLAVEV